MATSGVITSSLTAGQVVTRAMKELAVLSSGENPTAEEMSDGIEALNWLLKDLQTKGANLWRLAEGSGTITAAVASVLLSPRPIDVSDVRLVYTGRERQLTRYERADYYNLPTRAAVGDPTIYRVDRGLSGTTLYFWPVPSANMGFTYTYARVIEDVTAFTETLDVPQEWGRGLVFMTARELIGTFGTTRVDPNNAARVMAMADKLERELLDFDRPDSYYLGP